MRYDNPSIFMLRNPFGDEGLVNIVRAAVVDDPLKRTAVLLSMVDMPELKIDMLKPEDDLFASFVKYRQDILIEHSDMLTHAHFKKLTAELKQAEIPMPFLITFGEELGTEVQEYTQLYRRHLHIGQWLNPYSSAFLLRKTIVTEVLSRELLIEKLRSSASLTLKLLHAEGGTGFEYLLDEVTEVLKRPFFYFGSMRDIHKYTAEQRGVSVSAVEIAVRPVIENALASLSETEFALCFSDYISMDVKPGIPEFVYGAAKLTSISCRKIIHYLSIYPLTK